MNELAFDRVRVINRSGVMLFDNSKSGNSHGSATEALQAGQILSDDRLSAVLEAWAITRRLAIDRAATPDYIEGIDHNIAECKAEWKTRAAARAQANEADCGEHDYGD